MKRVRDRERERERERDLTQLNKYNFQAAHFIVPCGLRWLTKRCALKAFKKLIEDGRHSNCAKVVCFIGTLVHQPTIQSYLANLTPHSSLLPFQNLSQTYYSVPLNSLLESADDEEKKVIERAPETAM